MITSTPAFGRDVDDIDAVMPDPLGLLALWLPRPESDLRPLMTLTTIGEDGYPNARSVLLSAYDGACLYFHTDTRSRKAAELRANPKVSAVIVWPEIGRQVTVRGDAERTSPEHAASVFAARSRYLQLLAWTNDADLAQLPLPERRARWSEFGGLHPEGTLEPPPTWAGYQLSPTHLIFWRGDQEGPSNRVEYRREGGGWSFAKLPG